MRRIYQFKFYLNASHYVIFDGQRGETHPHTWELATKIQLLKDELVPFDVYERAIEQVFAPYQNKTMNEMAPFDTIVPSLESLVEVFGERLQGVVADLEAKLIEIEGSETPTRSYLLNYEDASRAAGSEAVEMPLVDDLDAGEIFDRLLEELS